MGRKSVTSGVSAKGKHRIQFDFEFHGKRYRPTVRRPPSEGNLRRAIKQLEGIRERIDQGTFNFNEEFPDYKFKNDVPQVRHEKFKRATCNDVFDSFLTC